MQNHQPKKTVVFSCLCFVVLFDATYTCPDSALIQPCTCVMGSWPSGPKMDITCADVRQSQVRKALAHVDEKGSVVWIALKRTSFDDGVVPAGLFEGVQLQRISISHSNLSSVDERAFADEPDEILTSLLLESNGLERVPTEALQKTPNLEYLSLDLNRLEVLHAEAFKGLHSLIILSLSGNKIKFIDDLAFSGMKNNRSFWLFLNHNELTVFPSRPLRNFSSVDSLFLHNNKIATLQPDEMAAMGCCALSSLYLAKNRIRQILPRTFESQKGLNSLHFDGNEIDFVHPEAFRGLEDTLRTLSLAENKLHEIPAASMRTMRQLKTLFLRGNNISTIRKDDFLEYGKGLEDIYLNNNSLTSVDPMAFVPLESAKVLTLEWNQLQTLPHKTYAPVLDTLLVLTVNGNPLHCECEIAWLREWMEGDGRKIVQDRHEITCASPEEFFDTPLELISKDQLIYQNLTSKTPRDCLTASGAVVNSIDGLLLLVLQIIIAYFYVGVGCWSRSATLFTR